MSGAALAAISGVGFGCFQTLNGRAMRGWQDPYGATLLQICIAALVLSTLAGATGDLRSVAGAPVGAIVAWALAGVLHFSLGWTFLNLSHQRIGAARTGPLLTLTPLFGVVLGALLAGQVPGALTLAAVAMMVGGAYVASGAGSGTDRLRLSDLAPALLCAACWAASPTLAVRALRGLDHPLSGLAIGLVAAVLVYATLLAALRRPLTAWRAEAGGALALKAVAAGLVAVATWGRWAALDHASIGVVLALSLLSVPVVLLSAPLLSDRGVERVGLDVWVGATLLVAGSLVLIGSG